MKKFSISIIIAAITGLPETVGAGYDGPTLFDQNYTANFEESDQILNNLYNDQSALQTWLEKRINYSGQ